jgi:hypothetical protein
MNASAQPTRMCWICGKVVDCQTSTTDEHGNGVHSKCYAAKMGLQERAQQSGKNIASATSQVPNISSNLASDGSTPELTYPEWQRLYQAALVETDHSRLKQKILDAEAKIFQRREQLRLSVMSTDASHPHRGASHAELMAISDALSSLNWLRNELGKKASDV